MRRVLQNCNGCGLYASGGLVFVYDKLVQYTLSILDIAAGAAALANSLALFHYFFGFFLALLPTFAMNTLMQCILLAVCNLTTLCIIHARP